jgi:hypothetical protein
VTEEEWLKAQDGSELLEFLAEDLPQSDRKMRLAACACCRRVAKFIGSPEFTSLLRLTEMSADDHSQGPERVRLRDRLHRAWQGTVAGRPLYEAADAACGSFLHAAESAKPRFWSFRSNDDLHYAAWSAISAQDAVGAEEPGNRAEANEAAAQSDLVRDIFGNPFRPVAFDPRWLTSDVVGLARATYDDRAFEPMPILADALMDAGCEDELIIGHCRGEGPHVRGCWVVDLVLGKE